MINKRIAMIFGCFIALIIGIWIISIEIAVKTGVQFITAPDNIDVTIKDKKFSINYETTIELKPGNYHVKLSRSDFKSYEQDISVSDGKITKLYSALEPINEAGKKIINNDIMNERRRIIFGNTSASEPEEKAKQYPFVDKLPIVDKYYVINPCYGQDNKQPFGICVILAIDNDTYRQKANISLQEKGIDINTIPIYYYKNTATKD